MRNCILKSCLLAGALVLCLNCASESSDPEKDSTSRPEQQATEHPPARAKPIAAVPLVFSNPQQGAEYGHTRRWALDQWSRKEIDLLFDDMQHDGVSLILLPASFGNESYYPSRILKNRLDYDAYAMLFDLAERHDMQVIMSGISYTHHHVFQGKSWDARADLEMNKRVFRELFELYGKRANFWGWYIVHETGDRTHRGDVMTILRELPPFLKKLAPDKKVAHSPWFTSRLTLGADATTPAQFAAEWDAILSESDGIDVFAIQDSTAPHEEIGTWFAAAAPVFRKHSVELWSTVELFYREPEFTMGKAVEFQRLREKMEAAAPYVKAYACWEYQNFLNPRSSLPGAAELNRAYRAHFASQRKE